MDCGFRCRNFHPKFSAGLLRDRLFYSGGFFPIEIVPTPPLSIGDNENYSIRLNLIIATLHWCLSVLHSKVYDQSRAVS